MTSVPIDVAKLAERRDPESRDVFVSLFVDLTDSRYEARLADRAKQIRAAVDDASAFDAAYEAAERALGDLRGRGSPRGAAVFASPAHDFVEAHALAAPVETTLVLDSSPYVRPLARFLDEYESFALVLLDGERAAVFLVDEARAERVGGKRLDLIGRHTKGGWSQMRYQRHRRGIVDRFLDDVNERVAAILRDGEADRVIVAGPGQTKRELVARAPKAVADAVVAVEDVDFSEAGAIDDTLVSRFVDLARDLEAADSAVAAAALRTALKRGDLATTGAFDVVRAARNGRVETLVVLKDHAAAGGAKCEEHESFFEAGARCGVCGSEGTRVDLVNEAIEYAARSESLVEFVDREQGAFLKDVGGVGAILRW